MRSRFGQRPLYKRAFCSPRELYIHVYVWWIYTARDDIIFWSRAGFNAGDSLGVKSARTGENGENGEIVLEKYYKVADQRRPITTADYDRGANKVGETKEAQRQSSPSESRISPTSRNESLVRHRVRKRHVFRVSFSPRKRYGILPRVSSLFLHSCSKFVGDGISIYLSKVRRRSSLSIGIFASLQF